MYACMRKHVHERIYILVNNLSLVIDNGEIDRNLFSMCIYKYQSIQCCIYKQFHVHIQNIKISIMHLRECAWGTAWTLQSRCDFAYCCDRRLWCPLLRCYRIVIVKNDDEQMYICTYIHIYNTHTYFNKASEALIVIGCRAKSHSTLDPAPSRWCVVYSNVSIFIVTKGSFFPDETTYEKQK